MAPEYRMIAIDETSGDNLSTAVGKKLDRVRSKIKHERSHHDLPMLHRLVSYESMDSSLFQPRYCSYGPYHMLKVQDDKEIKWRCLARLLDKYSICGPEFPASLVKCIQKLQEEARLCYEGITLSSDEFVEMLLLDSCSILFYLTSMKDSESPEIQNLQNFLFPDMLLIENQVPFFIIEAVWKYFTEVTKLTSSTSTLKVCDETNLINLFKRTPFWDDKSSVEVQKIDHLIHLYYLWNVPIVETKNEDIDHHVSITSAIKSYFPQILRVWSARLTSDKVRDPRPTSAMPSATELYEAGIKFRPKTNYCNMYDVSFENGILEIPTLVVTPKMMSLIANLVVFEVHSVGEYVEQRRVVSYVILMDSLINTNKDVALLQKCGVINNRLQSDQDFANFINGLGERFVNVSKNFFTPMIEQMMAYYYSSCGHHLTSLKHNYFSSPWTGIKVFAGTTLLILAFLHSCRPFSP